MYDFVSNGTVKGSVCASILDRLKITVCEGRGLLAMDSNGFSDPFCVLTYNSDKTTRFQTEIKFKTLTPKWDETVTFHVREPMNDRLNIMCWDYDKRTKNDFLGHLSIPVLASKNANGGKLDQWFPLLDKHATTKSESKKERGEVRLILEYLTEGHTGGEEPEVAKSETRTSQSSMRQSGRMETEWWDIKFSELVLGPELGRGAFGVVYRGKWRLQDVAVKQILSAGNPTLSEKQLEEFRAEAALMMGMRPHRNVVQLLGVCTDPAFPICAITEFLDYGSLESKLKAPEVMFNWQQITKICQGIAAGMYHLHCENIIHRDLAARNVLLRSNFEPKIADFGLSVQTAANATQESGFFRGPYKWMAPESLANNQFSIKSDVWSFGVTLWEILTRSCDPFPELNIYQAAEAVKGGLFLQPPPTAPPKYAQLMLSCFLRNPADRPDFAQINAVLEGIAAEVAALNL